MKLIQKEGLPLKLPPTQSEPTVTWSYSQLPMDAAAAAAATGELSREGKKWHLPSPYFPVPYYCSPLTQPSGTQLQVGFKNVGHRLSAPVV